MEKLDRDTDGSSLNIVQDNIDKLKTLFPDIFAESKIDFDKLKAALGDALETQEERYSFNWHGKSQARRIAQTPSTGTLRPCKKESKHWDTTQNLFIEGDNLEVLRLLQKSYHKQVKMIYIDPPYNTGGDFIYPDNYQDNLETYLEYTGQKDSEGRKFGTNAETSGRYHTNWLNMMYPRLRLARNLLRDDGIIFISINDQEQASLKLLVNEIFGEENFLAQLVWDKNHSAQAGIFKVYHEYIIVYAKNKERISAPKSPDSEEFGAGAMKKASARHPMQKFKFPKGTRFDAPHGTELVSSWGETEKVILHEGRMVSENGFLQEDVVLEAAFTQANQMKQYFFGDRDALLDSRGQKVTEFYFTATGKLKITKERGVYTPPTIGRWGTQGDISIKLAELFDMDAAPLETPKNPSMIREFIDWFCDDGNIILDFFAGSCSTAQAIMDSNCLKGNTKRFINVQLPEPCGEKSEVFKAGYPTIADIGKERIRRAGEKILRDNADKEGIENLDIGFKVFKLDSSNIKPWDADFDNLEDTLLNIVDNIKEDRSEDDVLYEILLKYGLDLTVPIEERQIAGKTVYAIGFGALVICLDDAITLDVVEGIGKLKNELAPEVMRVVFKDSGFQDDVVKTNAIQILKKHGIDDVKSL